MLIGAFFDESGKFKDHSTVSFAGVAGTQGDIQKFSDAWEQQLHRAGLKVLTMKEALNATMAMSKKRPAKGVAKRAEALLPFVECIREHLQLVISCAIDVEAFKALPSHVKKILANDPYYTAFTRILFEVMEPVHREDKLSIVCDDEEAVALKFYKLYRKIKLNYHDARSRLACLSFADDQVFPALQAADMIASLTRLEGRRVFGGSPYDYESLFNAFSQPIKTDRLWSFNTAFWGTEHLRGAADEIAKLQRKYPDGDLRLIPD